MKNVVHKLRTTSRNSCEFLGGRPGPGAVHRGVGEAQRTRGGGESNSKKEASRRFLSKPCSYRALWSKKPL